MELMQRRRELMAMQQSSFPAEYQQIEYIESSGTQCIDTNYVPTMSTNILCVKGSSPGAGLFNFIFGAGDNSPNQYGINGLYLNYFDKYNQAVQNQRQNEACTIKIENGILYINNVLLNDCSDATPSIQALPTMMIFCRSKLNGSTERFISMKLYAFKLYEGTTIMRDLLPCVRKSDSKPGMYDTVSKTFYTNAGTGEFIVPN